MVAVALNIQYPICRCYCRVTAVMQSVNVIVSYVVTYNVQSTAPLQLLCYLVLQVAAVLFTFCNYTPYALRRLCSRSFYLRLPAFAAPRRCSLYEFCLHNRSCTYYLSTYNIQHHCCLSNHVGIAQQFSDRRLIKLLLFNGCLLKHLPYANELL